MEGGRELGGRDGYDGGRELGREGRQGRKEGRGEEWKEGGS